ncbi:MAG: type II toxin-antitoxin system VapC family toxin [Chloroflexi bacterium]|nr:type II toxin-antitoxin system VapC family toxin [Chloroflexota bacterium]
MIIVDTSALIDSLVGPRRSAPRMRALIEGGERLMLPTLVLYEWFRGPRRSEELAAQEALFPSEDALPFDVQQASLAARLYRDASRPRGREIDLAIAAHAISRGAAFWTLNQHDFDDIPGLVTIPQR